MTKIDPVGIKAALAEAADARHNFLTMQGAAAKLLKRAQRAEEALRPFAAYMGDKGDLDNLGKPLPDEQGVGWVYLTMGDFRRARSTLTEATS